MLSGGAVKPSIREAILERDEHTCQMCKLFCVLELSGVPPDERLEVHHKTYKNYGHEEPDDLITVCKRCHDVITDYVRRLRYGTKIYKVEQDKIERPALEQVERKIDYDGDNQIQTDRIKPITDAQWSVSRSAQQIYESTERDKQQETQD